MLDAKDGEVDAIAERWKIEAVLALIRQVVPDRLLVAGLEKRQSKTFRFVQRLGYGKSEIYAAIVGLTVEDYSLGPLPDEKGRPHDLWVFGTYLEQYETYVKLVAFVSREGVEVVCVSFHDAERPLFYPYRKAS